MARSTFFGFNPPFFQPGGPIMPVQTDERLVKNDLLQLLLTLPGERVFRPTFGTSLRRTTFEPSDDVSISILRQTILDAILKFEPRVRVTSLAIQVSPDDTQFNMILEGSIINNPDLELKLELALPVGSVATSAPPNQVVT